MYFSGLFIINLSLSYFVLLTLSHTTIERTEDIIQMDRFVNEGINSSYFCSEYINEIQKINSSILPKFSYDIYQNWVFDVTSLVTVKRLQGILMKHNGKVNNR